MAMRTLGGLGHRNLRERWGRTLLTGAGVSLGVSLFFGALITNATSRGALEEAIAASTGAADVVVTSVGGPVATFSPDVLDRAREIDGVVEAVGLFGFPTTLHAPSGESLTFEINRPYPAILVGVDLEASGGVLPVRLESGTSPAPGEVVVSERFADELALDRADRVRLATPTGDLDVTVAGVLAPSGAGAFNDGKVVLAPLAWTQSVADRPGALSQILIALNDDIDAESWAENAATTLPGGVNVDAAEDARGASLLRQQVAATMGIFTVIGASVLFVAGFLIYLTLSTSVVERVRLYGTLHALGARRSQVRRLVVGEALLLGSMATIAGLALGVGVAFGVIALTGRMQANIGLGATPLTIPAWTIAAAVSLGLLTTVISALLPARWAARVDPVEAMRGDHSVRTRLSRAWIGGVIALVVGVAIGRFLPTASAATRLSLSAPVLLLGAVLLVPLILRPVARAVGILTSRLSRGLGEVAVLHLVRERTRSSYTLALVMIVMALVVSVGATHASFTSSFDREIERTFGADLQIGNTSEFPPGFAERVAAVEGVRMVTPLSIGTTMLLDGRDERRVQVRFVHPEDYLRVSSFILSDGSEQEIRRSLERGTGIVVPTAAADRYGWRTGDTVTLRTTEGPRGFEIAALAKISNGIPTMFLGNSVAETHFGFKRPTHYLVGLELGADSGAVEGRIQDELGQDSTVLVTTVSEAKADIRDQIAGVLNPFFGLLVLAGVIGLFGLTNTLAASMLERYREIGLLRAVGARRRGIWQMAFVESLTLVAVAFALALPLGVYLSLPLVDFAASVTTVSVDYTFPTGVLPYLVVGGLLAAGVTALGPARRAARLDIDEALRFE